MPMRRSYWLFLVFAILLSGCVTKNYYSNLNPNFAGLKYQRILIQFANLEPGLGPEGEKTLKQEIGNAFGPSIQCFLFSDEFYAAIQPKAEMSASIRRFLMENKIDGYLICISVQGVKKQTNVMSTMSGSVYANNDQKVAGYRMELFDLRTNHSVWYSTARMEGLSLLNSFKGMMTSFINKAVNDLKKHDILGLDVRPSTPFGIGSDKELPIPKQEI